ncbi:MAG: hypothetical protein IJI60_04060 [Bacilli bacterium]|nr:hypothetical protein [Bacilli bacterium]
MGLFNRGKEKNEENRYMDEVEFQDRLDKFDSIVNFHQSELDAMLGTSSSFDFDGAVKKYKDTGLLPGDEEEQSSIRR